MSRINFKLSGGYFKRKAIKYFKSTNIRETIEKLKFHSFSVKVNYFFFRFACIEAFNYSPATILFVL